MRRTGLRCPSSVGHDVARCGCVGSHNERHSPPLGSVALTRSIGPSISGSPGPRHCTCICCASPARCFRGVRALRSSAAEARRSRSRDGANGDHRALFVTSSSVANDCTTRRIRTRGKPPMPRRERRRTLPRTPISVADACDSRRRRGVTRAPASAKTHVVLRFRSARRRPPLEPFCSWRDLAGGRFTDVPHRSSPLDAKAHEPRKTRQPPSELGRPPARRRESGRASGAMGASSPPAFSLARSPVWRGLRTRAKPSTRREFSLNPGSSRASKGEPDRAFRLLRLRTLDWTQDSTCRDFLFCLRCAPPAF